LKLLLVAGARPNFMKIAPLIHELQARGKGTDEREISWKLVHTGQHYDYDMSKVFFDDFDIPEPDHFLNVGSGSHAEQTARIMVEFEKVCKAENPDIVVVVGDVNSTLACSITAKKMSIKVAHVEAGLRSRDMTMPEEINRIVTDSISDFLFVSEPSGRENLKKEGKDPGQVYYVGNIMIDTLHDSLKKLSAKGIAQCAGRIEQVSQPYAVVTLHRPSNVDVRETLAGILEALAEISKDMPVVFPIHPRTRKNIEAYGLMHIIERSKIKTMPLQSYLDFLALWKGAALVLTDSGGLQEESTALGIPCFTIRENTERPVTIEEGSNILVGINRQGILAAYADFKNVSRKTGRIPGLWDGKTARRIISILLAS